METYTLIVLVALFLGVMGIIAMMERRRRTELAQFEQLHQTITTCLGSLQASGEAQLAQVAEALSQVRAAIEASAKSSAESSATLSSDAARAVEKAAVRLESALLQHQKAQDAASQSVASKLSDVTQSTSKEILAEAQRTTKAVQALKASLEESVKF